MKLPDLLPSDLGERFRLVTGGALAVPVVVAAAFALSGAPGSSPDATRLWRELQDLRASQVVPVVIVALLLGVLIAPAQFTAVRLFEGYWGLSLVGHQFTRLGVRLQQRRRDSLQRRKILNVDEGEEPTPLDRGRAERCAARLTSHYPRREELLPTALGNALRAAERRAGDRYNLDAIVLWPRMYMVIASGPRQLIDSARDQVDMLVMLSVSLAVASVVAVPYVAAHGWWLVVPPLLFLLAVAAYRGAVTSAVSYGVLVQVAYDLYRFDLLDALHMPLPKDSNAERGVYYDLQHVLEGSTIKDKLPELRYSHPGAPATDSTSERMTGNGAAVLPGASSTPSDGTAVVNESVAPVRSR